MKQFKRITCIALSSLMLTSAVGCSKVGIGGKKIKKDDVQEAAEDALDAMIGLSAKKVKSFGDFDKGYAELLDYISDDDTSTIVFKKASYEVDEDSIDVDKDEASIDVVIYIPDYEDAYYNSWDLDEFEDEIDDQKKKDYNEIEVTLEFELDDDELVISNLDELFEEAFGDYFCFMTGYNDLDKVVEAYTDYKSSDDDDDDDDED